MNYMNYIMMTKKPQIEKEINKFKKELEIFKKFGRLDHSEFYRPLYKETIFNNPLYQFGYVNSQITSAKNMKNNRIPSKSVPSKKVTSEETTLEFKKEDKIIKKKPKRKTLSIPRKRKTEKLNRMSGKNFQRKKKSKSVKRQRFKSSKMKAKPRSKSHTRKASQGEEIFTDTLKMNFNPHNSILKKSDMTQQRFVDDIVDDAVDHDKLFGKTKKILYKALDDRRTGLDILSKKINKQTSGSQDVLKKTAGNFNQRFETPAGLIGYRTL